LIDHAHDAGADGQLRLLGHAEELADAYDLNRGVTRAILWASFAAIVVLAGFTFSHGHAQRGWQTEGAAHLLLNSAIDAGGIIGGLTRLGGAAERT